MDYIKERYQTELARLCIGPDDQEARETVREYIHAMNDAPSFTKTEPLGNFKLLAEFGDHVLCGRDDGHNFGFTFITWQKSYGGEGVMWGHYWPDYTAAKKDFAIRSGLVQEREILTPEQKVEAFRALHFYLQEGPDISDEQVSLCRDILNKLTDDSGPELIREQGFEMGGI